MQGVSHLTPAPHPTPCLALPRQPCPQAPPVKPHSPSYPRTGLPGSWVQQQQGNGVLWGQWSSAAGGKAGGTHGALCQGRERWGSSQAAAK